MRALSTLILLSTALASGQTAPPPEFEVASIKPSMAEPGSSSGMTTEKGRISGRNVTLKRCIRSAYGVPESQVFGGPKWVDEERYDIDAKAAGPAGDREMMVMLRSLLAQRFKLALHRETRPMNGYALLVAKTGLRIKSSAEGTPSRSQSTRVSIDATGCSMDHFAQKLSEVLHVPVADATGVPGAFDIELKWTPEDLQAKTPAAADPGLTIFTALQERLGLKLEARKVPTEVLVIDSAQKASEN